ncbi:MAG: hypothetical protein BWK80_47245 [Desulfobacteraceae bacterium IS3]|jgi:hypothetical protein|nr:MAG: hypothetical protein BWK80_47245 [Desulfobacteraceae bacterium IS3]
MKKLSSTSRLSYKKFTLQRVVEQFDLKTRISESLCKNIIPRTPSPLLKEMLEENLPLALAIGTEKAKSELLIMPILVEVRKLADRKISIFSGIEFNVEPESGLKGICDFLISKSDEQYVLRSPVAAVVEAKKGEIEIGIGQCAAEMIAARKFNDIHGSDNRNIWGVVTTGTNWKFLLLTEKQLTIQADEMPIDYIDKILGMFLNMIQGMC